MSANEPETSVSPERVSSAAEFVAVLNRFRLWAGQPSLRRLRMLGGQITTAHGAVDLLPPSTTSGILNGEAMHRLPRMEFVEAFVAACLRARGQTGTEIEREMVRWRDTWRRLAASQDPGTRPLGLPEATAGAVPTGAQGTGIGRNDLPGGIADFTGRAAEFRWLLSALPEEGGARAARAVFVIDGMAGVGKTVLAVLAAHRLAERYPDGQLFIDLHAHSADGDAVSPEAALEILLRAWGVPGDQIPAEVEARAALWRAQVAHRRVLIVLDDASSAAQVRPLLPGSAGCLTLVTSRKRLVDLDAARSLSLDVLPPKDAITLFTRALGNDRAAPESAAVGEVVRLCGYLPLAIRLAAGRLQARPAWSVAHLAERMRDSGRRLDELAAGDRRLTAAFAPSYKQLSPTGQSVFRLLCLLAEDDIDARLLATMAGCDVAKAEQALEALLDVHLLEQPSPGQYRLHELLRLYARLLTRSVVPET